jgi:hypothetical protein
LTRVKVKNLLIVLFLWMTACGPAIRPAPTLPGPSSAEMAHGVVFEDKNGNGIRDQGERPVAGVKVSNGVEVAATDQGGRYALPVSDGTIIFVIKPRNWVVPLDRHHLPQFYYIHKPKGSPENDYLFKGVPPTGPLPDSIDFPLQPSALLEADRFEVIVVADPQPSDLQELAWYAKDTVMEMVGTQAAFAITLGDLVGDKLNLYEFLNEIHAMVGIPWYNLPGNHDINFMSPDDTHANETFERVYGPTTYAFQYGRVHFILLDDVVWKGFSGLRAKDGLPITSNYEGGLRPDQLAFIRNYVETVPKDERIVLAMHIPLEGQGVHRVPQKETLFRILSGHPLTLSLSGHTHLQQHWFFPLPNGGEHHHFNVGTASGSWYRGAPDELSIPNSTMRDGTPNGYAVITFDGPAYSIRYKASRWPSDYQMTIQAPQQVTPEDLAKGVQILVNVFNGSEKSVVEMRIGKGNPWRPLERVARPDPFFAEQKALEAECRPKAWRDLPAPVISSHLWAGELPRDLPSGVQLIEIRTRDMFGGRHMGRSVIRVTRDSAR